MRHRLNTKAELLEYWRAHPELELQWHQGVRFNNWWWLRKGDRGETIDVHGGAARAVTMGKARGTLTRYKPMSVTEAFRRRCTAYELVPCKSSE